MATEYTVGTGKGQYFDIRAAESVRIVHEVRAEQARKAQEPGVLETFLLGIAKRIFPRLAYQTGNSF